MPINPLHMYRYVLTLWLLRLWELQDKRKQEMHEMSAPELDTIIIQITKAGKAVSDIITKRQLDYIPAPDLHKGYD